MTALRADKGVDSKRIRGLRVGLMARRPGLQRRRLTALDPIVADARPACTDEFSILDRLALVNR